MGDEPVFENAQGGAQKLGVGIERQEKRSAAATRGQVDGRREPQVLRRGDGDDLRPVGNDLTELLLITLVVHHDDFVVWSEKRIERVKTLREMIVDSEIDDEHRD